VNNHCAIILPQHTGYAVKADNVTSEEECKKSLKERRKIDAVTHDLQLSTAITHEAHHQSS
jgi:hypothetical protein